MATTSRQRLNKLQKRLWYGNLSLSYEYNSFEQAKLLVTVFYPDIKISILQLSTALTTQPPTDPPTQPTNQSTNIHLPIFLPTCTYVLLSAYLPRYQTTHPPTYLSPPTYACLPIPAYLYPPTYPRLLLNHPIT